MGAAGFLVVPWYALQDSVWTLGWLAHFAAKDVAPAWLQATTHGRAWLAPLGLLLLAGLVPLVPAMSSRARANLAIGVGAIGFVYVFAQGFAIGPTGWSCDSLKAAFGAIDGGQYGMGLGAALVATSFAMVFALGLADRGFFRGDAFVAGSVIAIAVLLGLFTFFPVAKVLISAAEDSEGAYSVTALPARLFTAKVWGLGCVTGAARCGVAWNTLLLAVACAAGCTALGLVFACSSPPAPRFPLRAVAAGFRIRSGRLVSRRR